VQERSSQLHPGLLFDKSNLFGRCNFWLFSIFRSAERVGMIRGLVTVLLVGALLTESAEAALLSNVQGAVTVDQGDGFKPALGGAAVSPGDRIRVASGSADIVYDNGCAVHVGAGQVVAIQYNPPSCGGGSSSSGSLKDPPSETPVMLYVGGGLLLAGGAAAGVILLTQKPASP
jgi:hypothetical protein